MPRGLWKGAISFGLVNVPVELYSAQKRSAELDLTMLDKRDLAPVGYQRVNKSTGKEVPWEDVVRYGMAQIKEGSSDGELEDVVEKPSMEEARSNLAMFGRFLLSEAVIQILTEIPQGKANELWLTDAVREYVRRGGRVVTESVVDGEWLTIGDPVNYLTTVIEYALSDSELRAALEPRLRSRLKS